MSLQITPKAQRIIAEKDSAITIGMSKQICYS